MGGQIFNDCLKFCCISPSSALVKKEVFNDFGFFDETLPACEDYDMWLRICAFERVLYLDRRLLIKYGGHPDQLSKRFWGMDRFRVYSLEKLLSDHSLPMKHKVAALDTLLTKIEILILGGRKRKNMELVTKYSKKLKYWINYKENLQSLHSGHV